MENDGGVEEEGNRRSVISKMDEGVAMAAAAAARAGGPWLHG